MKALLQLALKRIHSFKNSSIDYDGLLSQFKFYLQSPSWWVGVLSFSSTLQSLAFLQRSSSLGGLLAPPHPFISFINLTVSPLAKTPTTQTFSSFPDDFLIYIRNISSLQDHNSDCGPLASQYTNAL